MPGTIQMNMQEFDSKKTMCRGCEQNLLSGDRTPPGQSCDAAAMRSFMARFAELIDVIGSYKSALQTGVEALKAIKQTLVEADEAAAGRF